MIRLPRTPAPIRTLLASFLREKKKQRYVCEDKKGFPRNGMKD